MTTLANALKNPLITHPVRALAANGERARSRRARFRHTRWLLPVALWTAGSGVSVGAWRGVTMVDPSGAAAAQIAQFGALGFGMLLSTMLAVMVALDRRARANDATR